MSDTSEKTQVEEGNKADGPPAAVSFFHPALSGVRKTVALQWSRMGILTPSAMLRGSGE